MLQYFTSTNCYYKRIKCSANGTSRILTIATMYVLEGEILYIVVLYHTICSVHMLLDIPDFIMAMVCLHSTVHLEVADVVLSSETALSLHPPCMLV